MKKKVKSSISLVLFFILSFSCYAQLYPVHLTPVFSSPYSIKLSDYANSMDTKMQLLVNPTDISINNRPVRLKLYIQGNGLNVQTSDYVQGQKPIFINGGQLQTLTNTDIGFLFRLENLQGITALQYANGLPEGMYSFCFEMYDFVTNQKISQKSCASLYLILNDPPLLNTPQKNEQIAETDFPNIMFTWTPRHRNATNVSYRFELKQLMDPSLDPQVAFQMSPMLYEETLFGTALLYNLSMPTLMPGMRYAWRVRAISTTGLSENAIFKNDGYSEIYWFKYTQRCNAPTFALSEIVSPSTVKISWQGTPDQTKYQVQYRKKAIQETNKRGKTTEKTFEWFSTYSLNNQVLLANLEPETEYEFRVGSSCTTEAEGIQSFTYSNTNTFSIPKKENTIASYNCGIKPNLNITNKTPLTNLIQSETFTAGDFPVTVLELQGKNSPYSGRGYIIVPYLADTKIAVEFKNIVINTDYQLISGVVETSYNPDWGNVADVKEIANDFKGFFNEVSDLFNRANKLEEEKSAGIIGEEDYNKNWTEIYAGLEKTNEKYKTLLKTDGIPDDLKKKITDLDPVFVQLASNNFTTKGNQNSENLNKTNKTFDEVNQYFSDKCDASLKSIIAFLATEKVNYLKLAASEVSKNTSSYSGNGKTYATSTYDEENGTLKITYYKGWGNSNPPQHLFLVETKDPELNKLKITQFWLSYVPNNVDGYAGEVDVTLYFRDPVPDQNDPFCNQKATIVKGKSAQAQFSDDLGQIVFYSAMGMGAIEIMGVQKTAKCITGFSVDLGIQLAIFALIEKYQHPNQNLKVPDLLKEVSYLNAATSCVTNTFIQNCGVACSGLSGAVVGLGDDVIKQLKEGKSLSEVDFSQSLLQSALQGIIAMGSHQLISYGAKKWGEKYSEKLFKEAFEDLEKNSGKYGVEVVEDAEKAIVGAGNIGRINEIIINSVEGDIRKFSEYALTNPSKTGLFIDSWGYKLTDAESLLTIYKNQAIQAVKDGKIIVNGVDSFGNQLYKIETILNTPLKGEIKVYAGWIIKPSKVDEVILSTPFDGFAK